jgi:hypothetical protein
VTGSTHKTFGPAGVIVGNFPGAPTGTSGRIVAGLPLPTSNHHLGPSARSWPPTMNRFATQTASAGTPALRQVPGGPRHFVEGDLGYPRPGVLIRVCASGYDARRLRTTTS